MLGLTFGFKLPTGSHTKTGTLFADGSPVQIDPGLQPGSGTTDAIFGAYYFDMLSNAGVRGVQLTPRYTASVGARFSF